MGLVWEPSIIIRVLHVSSSVQGEALLRPTFHALRIAGRLPRQFFIPSFTEH